MQKYDVKRGLEKNLQPPQLKALVTEVFGGAVEEGDRIVVSFGALSKLTVWGEGKSLCVETQMRTDVSNDVASETISKYNAFLERTTGYTSKQRGKKIQAKAKKGES